MFTVSLVAVDQIGNPVNAIIQASLSYTESGLSEGQLTRKIPGGCTDLTFNVVFPHSSEELTLYASDGPCKDPELSKTTLEMQFFPCSCPIGLQPSGKDKTDCTNVNATEILVTTWNSLVATQDHSDGCNQTSGFPTLIMPSCLVI